MKIRSAIFKPLIILLSIGAISTYTNDIYAAKAKKTKLNLTKATVTDTCKVKLLVKNTKKKVKWKSSNKNIATVYSNGIVQTHDLGKVTITATVGKTKLKCKIKIVPGRVKHSKNVTGLHSNGLWYRGKYVESDRGSIPKIKRALLTDPEIKRFKKNYIKPGMTDVEKAMAIQKYFLNTGCLYTKKSTPKLSNYDKCPYCEFCYDAMGVIYSKQGKCEDYASATRLLCIVCDIPCVIVESEELDHRWCRVKIQGKWYNWDTTATDGYWGNQDDTKELNLNAARIMPALFNENEYWNANTSIYDEYKSYGLKKLPKADTSQAIWYILIDKDYASNESYLSDITNTKYEQGDIVKLSCNLKDTVGTLGIWKFLVDDGYKNFDISLFKHNSLLNTEDYKDEKDVKVLWKKYTSNKLRKDR